MTTPTTTEHEGCVLIVDDEEDVRESLRDVVEMAGCTAILASSGEDALKLLADHKPCLVLLDLMMLGMSGGETLEAMRRDPALASLPVIVSTSSPERAPRGVPVLPKPIDIDALLGWLRLECRCPSGPLPHPA